MINILLFLALFSSDTSSIKTEDIIIGYDYKKLMRQMAHDESRFEETGNCQVYCADTYGAYQMSVTFLHKLGYPVPMSCEKQHQAVLDGYKFHLDLIDSYFGGRDKWEGKVMQGIFLHKTNVLEAMWGAPYATLKFLKTGVNWGNGYWTVKSLLKKYEEEKYRFDIRRKIHRIESIATKQSIKYSRFTIPVKLDSVRFRDDRIEVFKKRNFISRFIHRNRKSKDLSHYRWFTRLKILRKI